MLLSKFVLYVVIFSDSNTNREQFYFMLLRMIEIEEKESAAKSVNKDREVIDPTTHGITFRITLFTRKFYSFNL